MAEIKIIGVVGGGQMGSGITQIAAVNGIDVWLHDTDVETLTRAKKSISDSIKRFVSKGQLYQRRKIFASMGFPMSGGKSIYLLKRCPQSFQNLHLELILLEI